jgi:halocyanin-like protein
MSTATSRRLFLSGLVAVGTALAGCAGGDGDDDEGAGSPTPADPSGEDYPAIDRWLTETSVGAADGTYEGTLVDARDSDTLDVDVGAPGNGDSLAFAPSAAVVSAGTTVRWVWTGEGGAHNVEAEPDEQLGESDYTFSSGEAVDSADEEYTQRLDSPGIVLYHCEPHLAVGMKGGIAVE